MKFVPVDAGSECWLGHVGLVVLVCTWFALPVVLLEDAGGVGFGAVHGAVPFAGASHVRLGQAAVVDEHALERGVEPSPEAVAVAWHGALRGQCGVEETKERAVFEEAFKPEIGAAQWQVGPPPSACARGGPGIVGMVLGVRAFCFASMSFQQAHQYFSAVWADGFPRSRHHAVSDVR